jgi:predicted nucleic acid-binding protein
VSLYLDASVLVALFTVDTFSARASGYFEPNKTLLLVSDFASALSRRVRTKELSREEAHRAFSNFDQFTERQAAHRIETSSGDMKAAEGFLRTLTLPLRAPDALNIAIAQRIGASLLTFDVKMAACARALGVDVPSA